MWPPSFGPSKCELSNSGRLPMDVLVVYCPLAELGRVHLGRHHLAFRTARFSQTRSPKGGHISWFNKRGPLTSNVVPRPPLQPIVGAGCVPSPRARFVVLRSGHQLATRANRTSSMSLPKSRFGSNSHGRWALTGAHPNDIDGTTAGSPSIPPGRRAQPVAR